MLGKLWLKEFIKYIFSELNSNEITYAVARNYDHLHEGDPGRDLDILIYENDIAAVVSIICKSGLKINGVVKREYVTSIFCYGLNDSSRYGIGIDLVHKLNYRAMPYLDVSDVLDRRLLIKSDLVNVYVTNHLDEALIILMEGVVVGGVVNQKYWDKLTPLCSKKELVHDYLGRYISKDVIDRLLLSLENTCEKEVLGVRQALHHSMLVSSMSSRPFQTLQRMLMHLYRELSIIFLQHNKKTICYLGPDGAGKSTVIDCVKEHLNGSFGHILVRHLKPVLLAKKRIHTRGIVTDPHAYPERGWFLSNLKIIVWFFELWIDRLVRLSRTQTLEIFDRCLYDVAVDARRYRFAGSTRLLNILIKYSPHIDGVIIIVASPEIIQSRKSEVTFQETSRQVCEYGNTASTNGFCFVINDQELQVAVESSINYIEKVSMNNLCDNLDD